ncbi:MAG: hypothetical protein CVU56_20845 [Deltaproteobacteria bacterium HGW-Deltaproteobacteria-14]|jgi:hypothetical protein|nr:MAG: hypothetical protein CVU56_20845 [Deltaproteobacteria bacterium HGW-Deltaproteobacteria-14]
MDDLEGVEEHRLHALFDRLRNRWVTVSERFTLELRRRLQEEPSADYQPVRPDRVAGSTLIELINMLKRVLAGDTPGDDDVHRAPPKAPPDEERR